VATRREARERALEILYEAEIKGIAAAAVVAELPLAPDDFVQDLVAGVEARRTELDEEISRRLRGDWTLERIGVLERLILRLGVWELRYHEETPRAVVLAEAAELAGRFGGDQSTKFVNGLLAAVGD
jgi:transcription antitermination protein NusB